jgi:hypothetical protein
MEIGRQGQIRFGDRNVMVEVVEDRGPIGSSGRRLVRVRFVDSNGDESTTFEVPADELVLSNEKGTS